MSLVGCERSVGRGDRGVDPRPTLRGRNQIVRRGGGRCWINSICARTCGEPVAPGRVAASVSWRLLAGERTTTSRTESDDAERRWRVSGWTAHSVAVLEVSRRTAVRCFKGSWRGRAVQCGAGRLRVGRLRYGVLECESRNPLLAACQCRSRLRNGTAVASTKSLSMLPVPCSPTWTRFKRDLLDDARFAQRQSGSEYRSGSGEAR